ncbi:MAG: hypothetical protein M3162_03015 [Thermoproteota archaeon]|nr:hypothetical protein [Thermoproteota archaeon]
MSFILNYYLHRVEVMLWISLLGVFSVAYLSTYAEEGYVIESLFISPFSTGSTAIIQDIVNIEKDAIKVSLLGNNVTDINLVENGSSPLKYVFVKDNELLIDNINSDNVRITYKTSGILQKEDRQWILSVNSTKNFMVMLPLDAKISFLEKTPSSLRLVGSQHLLTFEHGPAKIRYSTN